MTAAPVDPPAGNCARFAARPLTVGGTAAAAWRSALANAHEMDVADCGEVVVVAAHPDDETLGFGAAASTLAGRGARVRVVVVTDGSASQPGMTPKQRRRLAQQRRHELRTAAKVLGLPEPIWFGLPDGDVSAYERTLTDLLTGVLAERPGRTWCAANWRGDGHPDHEAVGRAAAQASLRSDAVLIEYPVWMWHWATPDDAAVPWDGLRVMPMAENAVGLKAAAAQCYRSQLEARSTGGPPVLPPFVLQRLLTVREVVFC